MRLVLVTYQSVRENGGWIFQLVLWWCAIMHADSLEMSHPYWRWSGLEKTSFLGLEWSGTQSRVPLHSHDEPSWSGMQTVLPDPMAGLNWRRYMNVLYNNYGTQTWLLIHFNESCSNGAYTKKTYLVSQHVWISVFVWLRPAEQNVFMELYIGLT